MMKIDYNKEVWEGWTVRNFINELAPQLHIIMSGLSWKKPFSTRKELVEWLLDNQPNYKKLIPEVRDYFAKKYKLK